MKKRVIVACGGAVATSTVAANKVVELCKKNGIDIEIVQCRVSEIQMNITGVALIVATSKVSKDYGIPFVSGMPFISGVGIEKTEEAILEALKD
ncbi:MAG: PTS galactitol transporter subunit IIB [Deltaproteobacteria bacterium]|jgi:PTS system galactitol-specific IIB component|nr:PTS galactitol transporter subunit IIB [Deltaproteobacteria bacterium]